MYNELENDIKNVITNGLKAMFPEGPLRKKMDKDEYDDDDDEYNDESKYIVNYDDLLITVSHKPYYSVDSMGQLTVSYKPYFDTDPNERLLEYCSTDEFIAFFTKSILEYAGITKPKFKEHVNGSYLEVLTGLPKTLKTTLHDNTILTIFTNQPEVAWKENSVPEIRVIATLTHEYTDNNGNTKYAKYDLILSFLIKRTSFIKDALYKLSDEFVKKNNLEDTLIELIQKSINNDSALMQTLVDKEVDICTIINDITKRASLMTHLVYSVFNNSVCEESNMRKNITTKNWAGEKVNFKTKNGLIINFNIIVYINDRLKRELVIGVSNITLSDNNTDNNEYDNESFLNIVHNLKTYITIPFINSFIDIIDEKIPEKDINTIDDFMKYLYLFYYS